MRVLIACEYSGRVRDAFIALGHEAKNKLLLREDIEEKKKQIKLTKKLEDYVEQCLNT